VDIFIKPNIVIEASGMDHFDKDSGLIRARYQKRTRQLERLGYKVIDIPYYEWNEAEERGRRLELLENKLKIALANNS